MTVCVSVCECKFFMNRQGLDAFRLGHTLTAPSAALVLERRTRTQTPEEAQSAVGLNFLPWLQVFTELVVQTIGQDPAVFSVLHVLPSV